MKHPRDLARSAAITVNPVLVIDTSDKRVVYQNARSLALFGPLQSFSQLESVADAADSEHFPALKGLYHFTTREGPRSFLLKTVERNGYLVKVLDEVTELEAALEDLYRVHHGDPLSKTLDRREFIFSLAREIARAERNVEPFQLLMLQIDRYQAIREESGADAADFVLGMVGELVRSTIRQVDVLGLYGEGCFGLILPCTDPGGGVWVAERTRKLVDSAPCEFEGSALDVSISVGLTDFRDADTPERLLQRAVEALDQAHQWGANQIQSSLA